MNDSRDMSQESSRTKGTPIPEGLKNNLKGQNNDIK